jgi:acyl carrier protein
MVESARMDVLEQIVYSAVEEAKQSIASAARLERSPSCVLFGDGGLDSLSLVRFIIMVEERIEEQTGRSVTLASEKAMSRRSSPFATLGALATYVAECLDEEQVGG